MFCQQRRRTVYFLLWSRLCYSDSYS